jgi:PKD repeat protein
MTEYQFPEFVADQLLTAEDLNNMFGYLEEQERLTRTTMIGIGIICGLEVKTASDGTNLTISRGGGDTSEGYLMRLETETFYEYKEFDALKPKYYDVFVNSTVESSGEIKRTQKFKLWEMFSKSETAAQPLNTAFLADKVVVLFYEMLEIDAKNCDPTSCDDKGRDVQVTIRKLLMRKDDAESLLPKEPQEKFIPKSFEMFGVPILQPLGFGSTYEDTFAKKLNLPDLRIKRFDVPATELVDTNDIFEAYQKIFSKTFIGAVDNALYQFHNLYRSLVKDVVTGNPFSSFASKFAFLHDGSISGNRLLHFQYYYGFFHDLLQAYEELRCLGIKLVAQCCPDPGLFPKHLLLGEAIPPPGQTRSRFRNYFIPSPILSNHGEMLSYFKLLYRRLALMIGKVEMPFPSTSMKDGVDVNIRITPSQLGNYPLAEKAIPFYYRVNDENGPLYQYWGYKWNCKFKPQHVLSYHAKNYNTSDDFVINPLSYDIEPYNFFRIEGHIGKNYKNVIATLNKVRAGSRLPFDVVAVSASLNEGQIDFTKTQCHFNDLESLYDSIKAQLICLLCKQMVYYYGFPPTHEMTAIPLKPNLPLLKACAPEFSLKLNTLGHEFELLWPSIKNLNDLNINLFYPQNMTFMAAGFVFDPNLFRKFLMFYMEKMFEQFGNYLGQFNEEQFAFYHTRMVAVAKALRTLLKNMLKNAEARAQQIELEDEIDQLDALLLACSSKALDALQEEYNRRLEQLRGLAQLNQFVKKHPGIEHKAGVPKGGTFVLVYFERPKATAAVAGNILAADFTENEDMVAENPILSEMLGLNAARNTAKARTAKSAAAKKTAARPDTAKVDRIARELKEMGIANEFLLNLQDNIVALPAFRAGLFDSKIGGYTDGVVVADFYLPYLCCSDCPPIQYIINEAVTPVTLSLEEDEFCGSEKKDYTFKVTPAGGVVTGEFVKETEDPASGTKTYTFNPSNVSFDGDEKKKEITFTYKVDEEEATFKITVYRKPVAQFEIEPSPDVHRRIRFVNKSEFGTLYEWDFGESNSASDTSTKEQPDPYTYKEEGSYPVVLKVTNGVCSDTATKVVTIVPQGAVNVSLEKLEYCNDEKGPFHFTVSPEGTKVEGEGVDSVGNNAFAFFPPVDLGTQKQKTVTFTATAPDGRTAPFNVVVYAHPPQPKFRADRQGTSNAVVFTVTSAPLASSFRWDFGDGQPPVTSAAMTITHTYLRNGGFGIQLVSLNGPCASEPAFGQVSVEQVLRVTKSCMPLLGLIEDFGQLENVNRQLFGAFIANFPVYEKMKDFYSGAVAVARGNREVQLRFFIERKVEVMLEQWIIETQKRFDSDFRTIALAFYRVLVNTAMLAACLKKTDINEEQPELSSVFKLIGSHLTKLAAAAGSLNDDQKKLMKGLLEEVNEELARLEASEEGKPNYKSAIERIITALKKMTT